MENIQQAAATSKALLPQAEKGRRIASLKELFRMSALNWHLYLLFICLALAAATLYLRVTLPVYERISDIEIKSSQETLEEESSFLDFVTHGSQSGMSNELYILRSLKLAREVAQNLHLDVQYFHTGFLSKEYLYDTRPFHVHFLDEYRQDIRLRIRPTSAQTFLILSIEQEGSVRELPSDVPPYFFGSPLKLPGTDVEVELTVDDKNYESLMSSLDQDVIVERTSMENAALRCHKMLSIEKQTNSVARITCQAGSVSEADDILSAVTSIYNSLSMQEKLAVIEGSAKFTEERIGEAIGNDSILLSGQKYELSENHKKEYVQYLLRKREELLLQQSIIGTDVRVVEDPMGSVSKISPDPKLVYLCFLAGGILLPFLLMLFSAMLVTTIRGRKDVEESLSIPFVGELPKNEIYALPSKWRERWNKLTFRYRENETEEIQKVLDLPDVDTRLLDAFHVLLSNMSYMNTAGGQSSLPQVMLFASLTPKSGKCFLSVNLTSILAEEKDTRCIWIDMDINFSHRYFNLLREEDRHLDMPGLTSYLSGKSELQDCIFRSVDNEAMDVMLAGPVPPNPTQLLMSDRLEAMMEVLRQTYKYIIINTGASSALNEAAICSRFADLTAFVVRVDRTRYTQLDEIERVCQSQRFKNACCVLTGSENTRRRLINAYKTGEGYDYA